MTGLTLFLAQRTALEAGDPVGIDPARDELAFFPLIYWPVIAGAPKPPQDAINRIDAYMKQGGTVLFDTRDAIEAPPGPNGESQTPGMLTLRNILSSLDVPELEPVPREHVLTKTFYLLRDFPGRFNSGQTWVETLPRDEDDDAASRPARGGDGVSPIIITSNDLAGAWAMRPDGQPMLPLTPGEPRQREFAFRAGVNIVMYTLTGNYKADQVHAPALIETAGAVMDLTQHALVTPRCAAPRMRTELAEGEYRQLRLMAEEHRASDAPRNDAAIGASADAIRHRLRAARPHARAVDRARRHRGDRGAAAGRPRARRGGARRGAGADPAGAGQSVVHPRGARAAVVGRRGRDRQEPEPEFRRAHQRNRAGAAKRWSTG